MPNYTRLPERELPLNPRLPLLGVPNQRAGVVEQDSRLINGYAEQGLDQRWHIIKRPGLVRHLQPTGAALPGRGLFVAEGGLMSVWRQESGGQYYEDFYRGSASVGFGSAVLGDDFEMYHGTPIFVGAELRGTYITNGDRSFYYDANTVSVVLPVKESTFSASVTTNGTAVVTHPGTTTFYKYTQVSGSGIPADTEIASIDSATQFTMTQAATNSTTASRDFVRSGPPIGLLGGHAVFLNRSVYQSTQPQYIYGSDLDDPTAWDWLNVVLAYATADNIVTLGAQLSTVLAFKETSIEAFRDAGLTPAPLARVEGFRLEVGLKDVNTLCEADDTLFWSAFSRSEQVGVWKMNNLRAEEVSNPAVRRILRENQSARQYGMVFSWGGHTFYLIAIEGIPALVYDATSGIWSYWTALGQDDWPFVAACNLDGVVYFQHRTDGWVYKFDEAAFTDHGDVDIVMDIYPPEFDGGTRLTKFLAKMYVNGDQVQGSELLLRVSDNNQLSWSNFRTFDLSAGRPFIENCGSFTKRFFHFRHIAPTSCRLNEVELAMQVGVL